MSRLLTFIFLLSIVALGQVKASQATDQLRFFVIGDWGSAGLGEDDSQVRVSIGMAKVATSLPPKFIISVGDNFYDNGVKSVTDPLWKQDWSDIYNQQSVQVPWYIVLGNHDYLGSVQSQIDFSKQNPLWKFPSRYYTQSITLPDKQHTTVDFVFLDTNPFTLDPDDVDQWQWIEDTLSNLRSDWKIVVGHHPAVACGKDDEDDFKRFQKRLKDLLDKHSVNMYICGHKHNLQYLQRHSVSYFVSGSGGRSSKVKHNCKDEDNHIVKYFEENGFMSFTLDNSQVTVNMFNHKGENLYEVSVDKKGKTITSVGLDSR